MTRLLREWAIAYRLGDNEEVGAGMRRILVEELSAAARQLRENEDRDAAVHAARKSCKKARATLRLVRDCLAAKQFRKTNRSIGAGGRALSDLRDARVLILTTERLASDARTQRQRAGLASLREVFSEQYDALSHEGSNQPALLESVARTLENLSGKIADWRFDADVGAAVRSGYGRAYRAGRAIFRQAYRDGDDETFHDWRKRVKDYWYATRMLRPLWPAVMKTTAEEAGVLAELIGDDHDLSVLEAAVHAAPSPLTRTSERSAVGDLIAARRTQLRRNAWVAGDRIYAEKTRAFQARIKAYWPTMANEGVALNGAGG